MASLWNRHCANCIGALSIVHYYTQLACRHTSQKSARRGHISETKLPIVANFLQMLPIAMTRSILPRQRCDTLCTSGFIDDIIFAHDGPSRWATRFAQCVGLHSESDLTMAAQI